MKSYKLIPKITLLILLLVGIAAVAVFFLGGNAGTYEVAGDQLPVPEYTSEFLFWNYALVGLVILVTFGFVIWKLIETFRVDYKRGLISVGVVLAAIGLCFLCWNFGSPEKVEILGYEGEENKGAMAQLTDAMMYLTYILTAATVVALLWGVVYTKVKK